MVHDRLDDTLHAKCIGLRTRSAIRSKTFSYTKFQDRIKAACRSGSLDSRGVRQNQSEIDPKLCLTPFRGEC